MFDDYPKVRLPVAMAGGLAVLVLLLAPSLYREYRGRPGKVTTALVRDWGVALESRRNEWESVQKAAAWRRFLRETAARSHPKLSLTDGWGNPLAIHLSATGYEVRSAGADGRFIAFDGEGPPGSDIVWANGGYVQFPEGTFAPVPDHLLVEKYHSPWRHCSGCHRKPAVSWRSG